MATSCLLANHPLPPHPTPCGTLSKHDTAKPVSGWRNSKDEPSEGSVSSRELCTALNLPDIEKPSPVMDSHDLDLFFSNSLDNSVVTENDLPDGFNFQFWNNSPQARVLGQAVCGAEGTIGKYRRNLRCIAGDKEADRLKVIESL
jgi:hypothetical protein